MVKEIVGTSKHIGNIDIKNSSERDYWCLQLNCTASDLIMAEYVTGANMSNIKKYLSKYKIWTNKTTI